MILAQRRHHFRNFGTKGTSVTKHQIKAVIAEIQRRYKVGKQILEKCPRRNSPGVVLRLAADFGINRNTALKLRVLADPDTGYTEKELKDLFQVFRKKGHALTISHFVKLISVPKGEKRRALTEQAIEGRWSSHKLQAEILVVLGRRKQGGRRPAVVDGGDVLGKLQQQLWSWRRWLTLHEEALKECDKQVVAGVQRLGQAMDRLTGQLATPVG